MKLKECIIGNQGQQFGFSTEAINVSEDDGTPQTPTQQISTLIDTNDSINKKRKYVRVALQNKSVFGLVSEDDATPQTPIQQMPPLINNNDSNNKKRKYVRAEPHNKTVFGLVKEQGAARDIYNSTLIDQLKLHNKYMCELVVEFRRFNNQGNRDFPITSSPIKDIKDMSEMDMTVEALDT